MRMGPKNQVLEMTWGKEAYGGEVGRKLFSVEGLLMKFLPTPPGLRSVDTCREDTEHLDK